MSLEARTLTTENVDELADWCGGRSVVEHHAINHELTFPGINVPVGKGMSVARASLGDTIVRQNDGTFEIIKKH